MAKNKAKTKLIKMQNRMGKVAGRSAWKTWKLLQKPEVKG
jgi:hypothetical protein